MIVFDVNIFVYVFCVDFVEYLIYGLWLNEVFVYELIGVLDMIFSGFVCIVIYFWIIIVLVLIDVVMVFICSFFVVLCM